VGGIAGFSTGGSFNKTEAFLQKLLRLNSTITAVLESAAKEGVAALQRSTPIESGLAASSWGYEVVQNGSSFTITWTNSDVENGFPVAIMLQYGYGTGTGGYVRGRDYINPAMKPVFDSIEQKVWKAVTSA
jgi:hypothetical protein